MIVGIVSLSACQSRTQVTSSRPATPTDAWAGGADVGEVFVDVGVAAKHQMVAVVDRAAERCIEEGPAAPARLPRRLMKDDRPARADKGHGAAEPGEPGTDDVDPAAPKFARRHGQTSPYLRTIQVFSAAVK